MRVCKSTLTLSTFFPWTHLAAYSPWPLHSSSLHLYPLLFSCLPWIPFPPAWDKNPTLCIWVVVIVLLNIFRSLSHGFNKSTLASYISEKKEHVMGQTESALSWSTPQCTVWRKLTSIWVLLSVAIPLHDHQGGALFQGSQDNDALTPPCPQHVHWPGSHSASCIPSTATIHPFRHNHLSVESKVRLGSSVGGECGVISVLLLRPITSHHFISMRERLDIKFPCTALSTAPVRSPSQSCCSEVPLFPPHRSFPAGKPTRQ